MGKSAPTGIDSGSDKNFLAKAGFIALGAMLFGGAGLIIAGLSVMIGGDPDEQARRATRRDAHQEAWRRFWANQAARQDALNARRAAFEQALQDWYSQRADPDRGPRPSSGIGAWESLGGALYGAAAAVRDGWQWARRAGGRFARGVRQARDARDAGDLDWWRQGRMRPKKPRFRTHPVDARPDAEDFGDEAFDDEGWGEEVLDAEVLDDERWNPAPGPVSDRTPATIPEPSRGEVPAVHPVPAARPPARADWTDNLNPEGVTRAWATPPAGNGVTTTGDRR